jgi:hypothetical protein
MMTALTPKHVIDVEEGQIRGLKNVFKLVGIDLDDVSRNRPWTPDGIAYLKELYLEGWTIEEIAKEMNRTPGSIVGQIYDLGEAGKLSFDMWGKKAKDKPKEKGPFRLFVLKDNKKPAGQTTSPFKAV